MLYVFVISVFLCFLFLILIENIYVFKDFQSSWVLGNKIPYNTVMVGKTIVLTFIIYTRDAKFCPLYITFRLTLPHLGSCQSGGGGLNLH